MRLNNLKNLRTLKSIDTAYETTSSFYDKGAVRRINTGHFGAKSTFELSKSSKIGFTLYSHPNAYSFESHNSAEQSLRWVIS